MEKIRIRDPGWKKSRILVTKEFPKNFIHRRHPDPDLDPQLDKILDPGQH